MPRVLAVLAMTLGVLTATRAHAQLTITLAPPNPTPVRSARDGIQQSRDALKQGKIDDAENLALGARKASATLAERVAVAAQLRAVAERYRTFGVSLGQVSLLQRALDICVDVLHTRPSYLGTVEAACAKTVYDVVTLKPTRPSLSEMRALRTSLNQVADRPAGDAAARSEVQNLRLELLVRLGSMETQFFLTMKDGLDLLTEARSLMPSDGDEKTMGIRANLLYWRARAAQTLLGPKDVDAAFNEALEAFSALSNRRTRTEQEVARDLELQALRSTFRFRKIDQTAAALKPCETLLREGRLSRVVPVAASQCGLALGDAAIAVKDYHSGIQQLTSVSTVLDGVTDAEALDASLEATTRRAAALMALGNRTAALSALESGAAVAKENIERNLLRLGRFEQTLHFDDIARWADWLHAVAFSESRRASAEEAESVISELMMTTSLYSDTLKAPLNDPGTGGAMADLMRARATMSDLKSACDDKNWCGDEDQEKLNAAAFDLQDAELAFAALKTSRRGSVGTLAALRKRIGKGATLLHFFRFRPYDPAQKALSSSDNYAAAILSSTEVAAVDLGPTERVDALIERYLETLKIQRLRGWDAAALNGIGAELSAAVLGPLGPGVLKSSRLYVVPVGNLALWPLEATPLSQGANAKYLIEMTEIIYLQSARQLLEPATTEARGSSGLAVVVGDPDFDAGVGPSRPGATSAGKWRRMASTQSVIKAIEREATNIGMKVMTLSDVAATKASVRKLPAGPRILAFATHGYSERKSATVHVNAHFQSPSGREIPADEALKVLLSGKPVTGFVDQGPATISFHDQASPLAESGLLLAGANGQSNPDSPFGNGRWNAYEMEAMDLRGTELVALVACRSAVGIVPPGNREVKTSDVMLQPQGEVVVGLRQAVFVAGAASVVATMWDVPAEATTAQVSEFVTLWLGATPRYRAFRAAELAALRRARSRRNGSGHPVEWAGLIYVGAPGD